MWIHDPLWPHGYKKDLLADSSDEADGATDTGTMNANKRKRDLYLVALLWEMICNLRDPMSLCHLVAAMRLQQTVQQILVR